MAIWALDDVLLVNLFLWALCLWQKLFSILFYDSFPLLFPSIFFLLWIKISMVIFLVYTFIVPIFLITHKMFKIGENWNLLKMNLELLDSHRSFNMVSPTYSVIYSSFYFNLTSFERFSLRLPMVFLCVNSWENVSVLIYFPLHTVQQFLSLASKILNPPDFFPASVTIFLLKLSLVPYFFKNIFSVTVQYYFILVFRCTA